MCPRPLVRLAERPHLHGVAALRGGVSGRVSERVSEKEVSERESGWESE